MELLSTLLSTISIIGGLLLFIYLIKSIIKGKIYEPGNDMHILDAPVFPSRIILWEKKPLSFFLVSLGYLAISILLIFGGFLVLTSA
jgi:hypothetical protein